MTIQFPKNYATGRTQTKQPAFYFQNQRKVPQNNFEKRSLNNGQKCRKPVFMRVSGICFIKWLWFGSICGESNGVISFEKVNKKGRRYKICCQQKKKH